MQPQVSRERQCVGSKDRLSQLPDGILHIILSYLRSTKEAARTSLLAQRWLNLWVSMPDLFFDYKSAKTTTDFINSVNRVLLLREASHLNIFSLCWHGGGYDQHISEVWVRHALMRNVKCLWLELDAYRSLSKLKVDFFESIFACQSLEVLSLKYRRPVIIPALKPSKLDRLKKMTLKSFVFADGTWMNPSPVCIELEELMLDTCFFGDSKIPSLALKKLTVQNCFLVGALEVLSPKFQTFHCFGNKGSGGFKFLHMEVVTKESNGCANTDDKEELKKWFKGVHNVI